MYVTGNKFYFNDSFNDSLYKLIGTEDWKNTPKLNIIDGLITPIEMSNKTPSSYTTNGVQLYYNKELIDTVKTKLFIVINEELMITKNKIYSSGKPIDRKIVSFPIRFLEEILPE